MEWKYPLPSLWQFLFDESMQWWSFPLVFCVYCFMKGTVFLLIPLQGTSSFTVEKEKWA